MGMLGLFRLGPLYDMVPFYDIDNSMERKNPISLDRRTYMAYPYYTFSKAVFAGNVEEGFSGFCLPLDLTKTQVLYMYGTHKRGHFHDKGGYKLL
jgi:hypothetical protein